MFLQVLGYCKKWKHAEALWFSGVANSILWFTFVKACWRSMSSVLGEYCLWYCSQFTGHKTVFIRDLALCAV